MAESEHDCGYIYSKDNYEFLCSISEKGFIRVLDLYCKNLRQVIDTNGYKLSYIIFWSKKYAIVSGSSNKSFKVIFKKKLMKKILKKNFLEGLNALKG